MSSQEAPFPSFSVALRASRIAWWLWLAVAVLCAYGLSRLPAWGPWLMVCVPWGLVRAWQQAGWNGQPAPRLFIDHYGQLLLEQHGILYQEQVLADSVAWPFLIVMRLQSGRCVVVWPDSTDAESRRALRVWLRWWVSPRLKHPDDKH